MPGGGWGSGVGEGEWFVWEGGCVGGVGNTWRSTLESTLKGTFDIVTRFSEYLIL